jgi:predicted glutamine amidotransferase
MCGIGGIVRWGQKPIEEEQIAILLVGNEHRGNDAAGLAIHQRDGSIDILKKDCPAWQLVTTDDYSKFIRERLHADSEAVLCHARGASQGNPRDNNNNHPMWAGHGAVIHNGVIRNDDMLFDSLKLERKAKTDSDILRAIVDKWGITEEAIRRMGKASGSGAIAAIHPDFHGKILLVRSGNPLQLASNQDFLYFASEKNTLHKACRPYIQRMGIWFQAQKPDVDFANMADNTGWIIGPKGLETHVECHICQGAYIEPWRKTYEEYAERQKKWNNRSSVPIKVYPERITETNGSQVKPAYCSHCKRDWVIPIAGAYNNYVCDKKQKGCGNSLTFPPVAVPKMVN